MVIPEKTVGNHHKLVVVDQRKRIDKKWLGGGILITKQVSIETG